MLETSLALALFPERDIGSFDGVEGYTAAEPGWLEQLTTDGVKALSKSGVLGSPAGATAEAGRAIFKALGEELATWITDAFELDVTHTLE
jgi:creatinine amidohydrolase/Fe(II)-dependent formamide hydrolase-like protein